METKKFTQFGTIVVILLLPLLILFITHAIKSGVENNPAFFILLPLALIFLICLLIFYKLTIIVDAETLSFRMGIGLIRKSYKISEIKSCKPVTNHLFILYNVTGFKAIELRFKYKSSIVRIGTNKPEEISQLIQSLIAVRKP